jgi:hypothetical protein
MTTKTCTKCKITRDKECKTCKNCRDVGLKSRQKRNSKGKQQTMEGKEQAKSSIV